MSAQHPLTAQLKPHLVKYPQQANSLFQSFLDLSLAQAWSRVEVVELEQCGKVVIKGVAKGRSHPSWVLPMALTQPTSIAELSSVFAALTSLASTAPSPSPSTAPSSTDASSSEPTRPTDSSTLYLAIVEKDSSVVYYVLKQGIWSPKEVPE